MDKDVRKYIMNIMKEGTGGCMHKEMTEALNCSTCKMKMIRAQSEYTRLRRQHPEKFIRKEIETGFSNKIENIDQMLEDRIRNDKLYRGHIKTLAYGTQEEKIREMRREQRGFYERHTGDYLRKML